MNIKKSFLLLFYLVFYISTYAQDTLTFEQCLHIAMEENLTIQEAVYSEELAVVQYKSNRAALLPTVNASASNNYSYGRSIDPYSNAFINMQFTSLSGSASGNLTLFNGFARINNIKLAKKELERNQSLIQNVKNEVTIELATLYTTILHLEELVKANKSQMELSKEQLKLLKIRFSEGVTAESELFKIESQIATEELNLLQNKNQLAMHYINLKILMNLPPNREIRLRKLLTQEWLRLDAEIDEQFLSDALKIHPLYHIAQANEEQSRINIAISRAGLFPTLSFGGNYGSFYTNSNPLYNFTQQWNNNRNYGFGFSLSIPVFNAWETRYRIQSSKISYKQAQTRTEIEKNNVSRILQQALNDLETAEQILDTSESNYISAQKSLEADQIKLEYGKIGITELSVTKNVFNNAEAALIKARYEYLFQKALIEFYRSNEFVF